MVGTDPSNPPDQPLIDACAAISGADATFIALLQGRVIGAGVELACACDLRLARPGVTLYVPASKLGVVYHARGIIRFHAVFGPALARRLILAGDSITAEEAFAAGALAELCPAGELLTAGERLGRRILAGSPGPLRAHRQLLRELDDTTIAPERLAEHRSLRSRTYAAADLASVHRRALERKS